MQRCWMNDFYVYLHRKKSDGRVFYVGKGRDRRAYRGDKSSRSDKWLNTANKYGWFVEIVFDNLSEDEAYALEVDTILEMQHFNEPLVNHNKGGHGGSVTTYTETFGKRVSDGLKRYYAKHESHRKGCEGLRFWNNGNLDDKAWLNLDTIFRYYEVGLRYSTLSRVFPEVSKTVFHTVCKYFEKYGDPLKDEKWLKYSQSHPNYALIELPTRGVSKNSCYGVIENIYEFQRLVEEGHGTKGIAKKLNIPVSEVGNMLKKMRKGYDCNTDPVISLIHNRLKMLADAEDLEGGQDD